MLFAQLENVTVLSSERCVVFVTVDLNLFLTSVVSAMFFTCVSYLLIGGSFFAVCRVYVKAMHDMFHGKFMQACGDIGSMIILCNSVGKRHVIGAFLCGVALEMGGVTIISLVYLLNKLYSIILF